jgi:hypothetical protein
LPEEKEAADRYLDHGAGAVIGAGFPGTLFLFNRSVSERASRCRAGL